MVLTSTVDVLKYYLSSLQDCNAPPHTHTHIHTQNKNFEKPKGSKHNTQAFNFGYKVTFIFSLKDKNNTSTARVQS